MANLGRLQLPEAAPKDGPRTFPDYLMTNNDPTGHFKDGDLVVYPPDQPQAWFHVPRTIIEQCEEVPASQVADLEFMATEEGAVLANVPKVTPQGCTCVLLSLVGLRTGMLQQSAVKSGESKTLKQPVDKTEHAKLMHAALQRGHQKNR